MEISREVFDQQRHRRFGTTNPERMKLIHWERMARSKDSPYRVLKHHGAELDTANGPDWCFSRYGMTTTQLNDGRTIYIGGEYEDWYDEEFCIYNDVVVFGPNDALAIYCYPRESFPPVDFHTATLVDNRIIVIGGLGYSKERHPGKTPVFSLETTTYRIDPLNTSGQNPGWIFNHLVQYDHNRHVIQLSGGKLICGNESEQRYLRNCEDYELDLHTSTWSRITQRNWRQFQITFFDANGKRCYPKPRFEPASCLPNGVQYEELEEHPYRGWRIRENGIPIVLWDEGNLMSIVIEGELADNLAATILSDVMKYIRNHYRCRCELDALN